MRRPARPGCNIESQTFKAAAASFNAKEAMLVGISADSVDSHKSYKVSAIRY